MFLGFFFVCFGYIKNFLFRSELMILILFEVVAFEKSANSQSDLSFTPVAFEDFLSDCFVVGDSILDNPTNELIVLIFGPIVTFLDIEVLEVE